MVPFPRYNFDIYWTVRTKDGRCSYDASLKAHAPFEPNKGMLLLTHTSVGEVPVIRVERRSRNFLPEVQLQDYIVVSEQALDTLVAEMIKAGWN